MRRAIEVQPNAPNSHLALGLVLKSESQLPAALEEFKTAVTLDPNRALARQQVAEVEARLKNSSRTETQSR
jgi:Tfp pilus assembly protein PilF